MQFSESCHGISLRISLHDSRFTYVCTPIALHTLSRRALDPTTSPLDQPNDTHVAQHPKSHSKAQLTPSPLSDTSHLCISNILDADLSPSSLLLLSCAHTGSQLPGPGCWKPAAGSLVLILRSARRAYQECTARSFARILSAILTCRAAKSSVRDLILSAMRWDLGAFGMVTFSVGIVEVGRRHRIAIASRSPVRVRSLVFGFLGM